MAPTNRILDLAGDFVVCAGTVTLDVARRRVLLLHYVRKGEHLPPKGHVDRGESLAAAALRETREETGFACRLRPHRLPTHATRPVPAPATAVPAEAAAVDAPPATDVSSATEPANAETSTTLASGAAEQPPPSLAADDDESHVEPLACQQRQVRGARKLVFWFLAEGDAAAAPGARPPEDVAQFEPVWVPYAELRAVLTWPDDRRIVEQALGAVGASMWADAAGGGDPFERVEEGDGT